MPVYSFKCNDCGHEFDKFFFGIGKKEGLPCPKCKSDHTTKKISVTSTQIGDKGSDNSQCLPKFGFG